MPFAACRLQHGAATRSNAERSPSLNLESLFMKPLSPIRLAASTSLFALFLFQLSATPALAFAGVAIPDGAAAQEPSGFGPIDPAPPAAITPDEIIKKFGEPESAFQK